MKYSWVLEWFLTILKVVGPAIILIFILAVLAGIIKWTIKTRANIKEVSRNPIILFLWLILSILAIYLFYKYAVPLIGG